MRSFLAITLPNEVKARLADTARRLAPLAADVKWCGKDQLHLTLAYLGETSPAILPHVTAVTDRVCAAFPVFTCRAYGLGFFGTKRNPQSLWAGVDPSPELESLYERLWMELKKFGYQNDELDFRPHVTLGRCREAVRNRAVIEAMDEQEEVDFGSWQVARVTFYESRLTPRGAVYRTLGHSALMDG